MVNRYTDIDGSTDIIKHLERYNVNLYSVFKVDVISTSNNYHHLQIECKKCNKIMNLSLLRNNNIIEFIINMYNAYMMNHFFGNNSRVLCDVVNEDK